MIATFGWAAAFGSALLTFVGPSGVAAAAAADGPPVASRPDAVAALRNRLGDRRLRLSSEEGSPERFAFDVTVTSGGLEPMVLSVERDGGRVAVLARSAAGLPYFYATNGLVAKIDSNRPGQLLVVPGASFDLFWSTDPATKGNRFNISLNADRTRIDVSVGDLLRQWLSEATAARAGEDGRTVRVETPVAVVSVVPAEATDDGFPLVALDVEAKNGSRLHLGGVRLTPGPTGILGRAAADFAGLGVPTASEPWKAETAGRQAPVTPQGFWAKPENAQTGRALATLFPRLGPAAPAAAPGPKVDPDALRKDAAGVLASLAEAARAPGFPDDAAKGIAEVLSRRGKDVDAIVRRYAAGELAADEALRQTGAALAVGPELRGRLPADRYATFARRWLGRRDRDAAPDPIRDMLGTLLVESAKLDLSPLQESELTTLCLGILNRSDAIRRASALGQVGPAEIKQASSDFTEQLVNGLQRVLSRRQYEAMEGAIRARIGAPASRPAPGRGERA